MTGKPNTDAALVVSIGLVVAGLILGIALSGGNDDTRVVEVTGQAEREVPANLVVWPIVYAVTARDLDELYERIDRADESVTAFLKLNGFSDEQITRKPPRVRDRWLDGGEPPRSEQPPDARYVAERTLTLRSGRVESVRAAMDEATELIGQGVALTPDRNAGAEFAFTRLDEVRAEMIAKARRDARAAAEQLAGNRVGRIRGARRPQFTVDPRDPASPHIKLVRVITTIEYDLEPID